MKQLTCEMCGSTDLIKQDGVFVCQSCGCKYSVEEAKKMMIEGTVEVTGTVKVDSAENIEKFLENARRAKKKEDWEETEKYYNLVEQHEPSNIEAIFYSSYGKAKRSLVEDDLYKRQAIFKVLQNCISIIDDNFDINKKEQGKIAIQQISADIINIVNSDFVYQKETGAYGLEMSNNAFETYKLFAMLQFEMTITLDNILKKYIKENLGIEAIYLFELIINHANCALALKTKAKLTREERNSLNELIHKAHINWHELDSQHEIPEESNNEGGCYIATCVYGSYDCPQVWTLRRYRDDTLGITWYGRLFIRTYYAISPTLVKWFGKTKWFKKMWKGKLDRMVQKLQDNGVENTPYEDKEW